MENREHYKGENVKITIGGVEVKGVKFISYGSCNRHLKRPIQYDQEKLKRILVANFLIPLPPFKQGFSQN